MCRWVRSVFIVIREDPKHEKGETREPEKADAGTPQSLLSVFISFRILVPSVLVRLFLGPEELLLLPIKLLLVLAILLIVVVVGAPLVAVSRPIILPGIAPSPELLFEISSLPVEIIGTPVGVLFLGPVLLVIS